MDVDRPLLVSKMKTSLILAKYTDIFFSILKPKVVYLRSFLSFLTFPKFLKQNFKHFWHKHVETGLNCSHELSIYLKYHMPLRKD